MLKGRVRNVTIQAAQWTALLAAHDVLVELAKQQGWCHKIAGGASKLVSLQWFSTTLRSHDSFGEYEYRAATVRFLNAAGEVTIFVGVTKGDDGLWHRCGRGGDICVSRSGSTTVQTCYTVSNGRVVIH